MPRRLRPVAADAGFEEQPWRPIAWLQVATIALLAGFLGGVLLVFFWHPGPKGPYRYSLTRWEANTLAGSMFNRIGIGPDPSGQAADDALVKYFGLTSSIRAELDKPQPDVTLIAALDNERHTYENDVERIVESYVASAIQESGLKEPLPLFSGVRVVWPPVDFELTGPPQLLVRSPRDAIRREGDTLLQPDLTLAQVQKLEDETTNADTVSIVVSVGGIAAYPAIVRDNRTYDSLLETASHEWVHHYLAFFPLGRTWGSGGDSEALNETTANIAGRALAELIKERHPIQFPDGKDGSAPSRPAPTIDFQSVMRQLRLDVDGLLAKGDVTGAEQLMEERRQYLEDNGIYIRKINQAYFAFYGTYADQPASSNPVGPKIERVFELTDNDVGLFLKVMRNVTSAEDLDRLLQEVAGVDPSSIGETP